MPHLRYKDAQGGNTDTQDAYEENRQRWPLTHTQGVEAQAKESPSRQKRVPLRQWVAVEAVDRGPLALGRSTGVLWRWAVQQLCIALVRI